MFVLPINRDEAPSRAPVVTCGLILVNSLVWLGLTAAGVNKSVDSLYGLHPVHWTLVTLFTHMFLHGGLWHVAGNMFFLWMFAPKLEARLGSFLFCLAYLACGVGAAGLETIFAPNSTIPMVGASGAISGVAGMYFVLFPRSPFELQLYLGWWRVKSFNAMTRGAVGIWILEQFVLGLITSATHSVGIAFWAHVGGFISGFIIAAIVAVGATPKEQEQILNPTPLSEEEKEELYADREEQPSEIVSLKLNE